LDQDLNPGPPKNEENVLTSVLRLSLEYDVLEVSLSESFIYERL
jgi:hypothetical protein